MCVEENLINSFFWNGNSPKPKYVQFTIIENQHLHLKSRNQRTFCIIAGKKWFKLCNHSQGWCWLIIIKPLKGPKFVASSHADRFGFNCPYFKISASEFSASTPIQWSVTFNPVSTTNKMPFSSIVSDIGLWIQVQVFWICLSEFASWNLGK